MIFKTLFQLATPPGFQANHTPQGNLVDHTIPGTLVWGGRCYFAVACVEANCFAQVIIKSVLSSPPLQLETPLELQANHIPQGNLVPY